MAINDFLNRLSRKREIDETNPDTYDTGLTSTDQDVETQLDEDEQNREIPPMMQGVPYTERPEREPILDRDAMFKSQAAVDEGINAPGVVESGETSQEEFDKLRGNILADAQKPTAEPPKSKEQLILEQLQKMRQDSDEELKSAKSRDRWLSLANSLNNALSRFDQASVLKATRTPGMQAIAPGVLASTSSAKEVLAERQAKINELLQEQKLMAALQPKTMSKLDQAKIKELEAKAKMYEKQASAQAKGPKTKFQEEKEKLTAKRYEEVKGQIPSTTAYIDEAKELAKLIKEGELSTGPGAEWAGNIGAVFGTTESSYKQRLDALSEIAARARLKATGDTRPTDEDVAGMKKAMFNLGNTEATNIKKLQDFVKQQESVVNEYKQMQGQLEQGRGLEDFLLKDTYQGAQKDVRVDQFYEKNKSKFKNKEEATQYLIKKGMI